MDADAVLRFYDSCWFEHEILKEQDVSPNCVENPDAKSCQSEEQPSSEPEISSASSPTLRARSMSDQSSSQTGFQDYPPSSKSAILQTILSGKEAFGNLRQEEAEKASPPPEIMSSAETGEEEEEGAERRRRRRGRRGVGQQRKGFSKSLSDLEFEELKGFMDLGFVFSEEDKDSSLVSVIPGLQRLGMKKEEGEEKEEQRKSAEESVVTRPYLSEAWEVLGRRKDENPLKNWMIPASNNEGDVKDNLRWWAHAVASTVR